MPSLAALLLSTALAADPAPTASADAPSADAEPARAPRKASWFSSIRYGLGVSSHFGLGTDGTTFGRRVVAEPLAFELRSFLAPRFAFHTTLNLGRMIAPAIKSGDGRIDYGCHLGGHVPLGEKVVLVVAPGADIAYSFTGSRYQRFTGDVRLGVDLVRGDWTTGFYLRPYGGWWREAGAARGQAIGGALLEIANIWHVPKMGRKPRRGAR